jgi:hypothetical protein
MRRKLLKIGLVFFTLAGLYCVWTRVSLLSDVVSSNYSADQAEWYRLIYTVGGTISFLCFIFCIVILAKTEKK